jgi:hypothetical protein
MFLAKSSIGKVTRLMPHFTTTTHISADPSSPECLLKARTWLDCCIKSHGSFRCPKATEKVLPTRLICVGNEHTDPFLYEPKSEERGVWAALSYCWGKVQCLTTIKASLPSHKMGIALDALPKTCRDAILVTRSLSIPYLWIDALCIVQDSTADWDREAARMCYVYENAVVTLAAPESNSSDKGLFLSNSSRGTVKLEADIDGQIGKVYVRRILSNSMFPMHKHPGKLPDTFIGTNPILETRAWTLQELLLSPRVLWFGSAEIGWSCWSATACECEPTQTFERLKHEMDVGGEGLKISSSTHPVMTGTIDWSETWCDLVQKFTIRDLTVSTDRLPAMSGLASALQTHIQSEYLAGLWKSALSTQLLWTSLWLVWEDDVAFSLPFEDDYAPSWTWASVPGQVRFPNKLETNHATPIWQISSVNYQHLGLNQFGRGEGSITIESNLLPVRWCNNELVWQPPWEADSYSERILFTIGDRILWDPRMKTRDLSGLSQRRLWFLAGSLYQPRSKNRSHCKGIVLEGPSEQNTFVRLGYAEPNFDLSDTGSWDAWLHRFTWTTVVLV